MNKADCTSMYEVIKDMFDEKMQEKIARNAWASWLKNKEVIIKELEEVFRGKTPSDKDVLMPLMYAVGYKDAIEQYVLERSK